MMIGITPVTRCQWLLLRLHLGQVEKVELGRGCDARHVFKKENDSRSEI